MMEQDGRLRCSIACVPCRRSRRRCTGERPCVNCVERGDICEYTIPKKRGPPPKAKDNSVSTSPTSGTTNKPFHHNNIRNNKATRKTTRDEEITYTSNKSYNMVPNKPYDNNTLLTNDIKPFMDPILKQENGGPPPSKYSRTMNTNEAIPPHLINIKLTDSPNIMGAIGYPNIPNSNKLLPPVSSTSLLNLSSESNPINTNSPLVYTDPRSILLAKHNLISPKSTPTTNWLFKPPSTGSFLDLSKAAEGSVVTSVVTSNSLLPSTLGPSRNTPSLLALTTPSFDTLNSKSVATPETLYLPPPPTTLIRDESNSGMLNTSIITTGSTTNTLNTLWSPDLEF